MTDYAYLDCGRWWDKPAHQCTHLARGFVSDSRFGGGQVIKRTNRQSTRKWRKVGEAAPPPPEEEYLDEF